jgi:hypothetical protein
MNDQQRNDTLYDADIKNKPVSQPATELWRVKI